MKVNFGCRHMNELFWGLVVGLGESKVMCIAKRDDLS